MPSKKDGVMIILSSPSGAGKTTLVKMLSVLDNFEISISHTTRRPRPNEIYNEDYFFISEDEFKNLIKKLKIEKTVSGGSVANSIVGLSQLGNQVGFIGKVSDDELGSEYENGLNKENVKYFYSIYQLRVFL